MAELKRGLEGVIAAETKISSIIDSQLTYLYLREMYYG